ncbi:MAG TPA: TetR/AcrR family transcriptional regulator [Terracidiphilus sp.]|jgi:AcrR family transcriptional regulator|nr:TetR/AcrR family transcriptional regulator [Terracidiphilus sp.]
MREKKATEKAATRGRPSRRPQIIAATEKLIRTRGLANTTTKAIAAEVGCSEGALYVHFASRSELLLAVLEESLPDMLIPLRALEQVVGKATPRENLQHALIGIFAFHERVIPGVCALFAEPALLADYRKSLVAQNKGPQGAIARLRKYISAEQKLGRVGRGVDPEVAATNLMANSFFRSFVGQFLGKPEPFEPFCKRLVAKVLSS